MNAGEQKSRGSRGNVALFIEIKPDVKESLEAIAKERGESLSTIVREILRQAIEHR